MTNVRLLNEKRNENAEKHKEKVLALFRDHPEIAEGALIIAPEQGIVLTPEGMEPALIVGLLETAKFRILANLYDQVGPKE